MALSSAFLSWWASVCDARSRRERALKALAWWVSRTLKPEGLKP